MKRILWISFILLSALCGELYAQQRTVSGKVTSGTDGEGLPGVTIRLKGTSTGVNTDFDGNYKLEVPSEGGTLIFSFIGFKTQEVAIGSRSAIDIVLEEDLKELKEVVVVAYGTDNKGSFTGSASQISTEKIAQRPVTNITSAIEGQAAGVQTTMASGQPGSGPSIKIRGIGSYSSSTDPLYVVDGVPYSGSISNLNSSDIESISILKDASSSSLYGARAANGVVMITTKRGKKGNAQINVKASNGISTRAIPEYDRVNAYEYYPLVWEGLRNSLFYGSNSYSMEDANLIASGLKVDNAGKNIGIKKTLGYNPFNVPDDQIILPNGTINPNAKLLYADDLDWFKPLMRNGRRSDYSISVGGASDKTDYFFSLGYLDEKGFLIKSDYERFTGRLNVNSQVLDWFKTGLNISGTMTESNQANDANSNSYVNPFNFSRNIGPIYPVYAHDPLTGEYLLDERGNKIYDLGNMAELGLPKRGSDGNVGRHVIAETMWNDNLFKRNVLSARTYGQITFLKDFKFTTNISIDVSNYLESEYDNNIVGDGAPAGRASRTSTTTTSYNFNQLLNYTRAFERHYVEALFGHENYDFTYNYLYGMRQGVILEGNSELGNFTTTNSLTSRTDRYRTEGFFSRLKYTYDERYTASFSYRRDGSSRFYKDVRWGDFWSVGASWRLDKESFMTLPAWVNMLKLRGSYGQVGNDAMLNDDSDDVYYAWQALYGIGNYNNAEEAGFLQESLSSKDLVWESSNSFDVGMEFTLFKGRIDGSVEFFNRESENLLFKVPLPLSSGVLSKYDNVGTMYNRGVEFHISADVVEKANFGWNVDINLASYKNRFTKLPQDEIINGTKKLMTGRSIYEYWLRDWYGVDPADGAGLFVANTWDENNCRIINGDTVTTSANNAKYHYAGTAIPDFSGGITNTFTYKNFTLSALLTYSVGGKVYDANYAALMNAGTEGGALHKDALKRWQKPGDVTDVPRMDLKDATEYNAASDRWLVDASYLNFRSINLSYNLPESLASKIKMQNAQIYVTGENLGVISARKGMNVNQSSTGVTSNAYAPARIVTLGLNVTL